MAVVPGTRRRAILIVALAGLVAVAVGLATWAPATPPASDATPLPSDVASAPPPFEPSPSPVAGGTQPLPRCESSVRPRRAVKPEAVPPVPGPVALRVVGQLGGAARAATLDGDRLFVGAGSQIIDVDLTDPRRPLEMAMSGPLSGTVEDVTRAGDLLVVAAGDGGVALIDPTNGLSVRSTLALPGHAKGAAVHGTFAFVADGPGGLRIVSIADPATPHEVAALFDLHRILDVAIDGSVAYLAAADEGLLIVDISEPRSPRALGTLFTGGYAYGVAVDGERVLLADGAAGLRTIDVADPAAPRLMATLPTLAWVMDVQVDRGRAFAAVGRDGIEVVDLADPDRPTVVGNVPFSNGHAIASSVAGNLAAVVDDTLGVRIVDVSASTPVELSAYGPLAAADGLTLLDTRVYVAAKGQGLRVVDVSDARVPVEAPGVRTRGAVRGVAAAGRNLFVTMITPPFDQSLFGLDLSDPGRLAPGPSFAFRGNNVAMTGDGSMVLIAAEGGLWIVDGSRSIACELAYLDTQAEGFLAGGVAAAGDIAYLPSEGGIRVVDISDPRAPVSVGNAQADDDRVRGKEWAQAMVVGSNLFSIANYAGYLGVYALERPTEPRLTGLLQLPAETATNDQTGPFIAYAGGHLFVADEAGGLVAVDVADPSRPEIAGRLRLPGSVEGVVSDGDHLYVASDGGGLFVIDWADGGLAGFPPSAGSGEIELAAFREPVPRTPGQPRVPGACLVTSTADSGPGSLRGCLDQAQAGTAVTFDPDVFPPEQPATIHVREGPLGVPGRVVVDGAGAGVILDGDGKTETAFGVFESETVISGLEVTHFTGFGIDLGGSGQTVSRMVIHGNGEGGIRACCNASSAGSGGDEADHFRIVGNLIGLDRSGSRLLDSQEFGIYVQGVGHVVGGPNPADRNVIAGSHVQVELDAAAGVTIEGNYVGIDAGGRIALDDPGHSRAIVGESGASGNRVVDNVVNGVIQFLDPGSSYNLITGNLVGVDPGGNRPLGGGQILIGEPFNQVGGAAPGDGNVVSGGILVGGSDVIVLGNRIDVGRDGQPLRNGGHIDCSKDRCVIGGRSPGAANVVGGAGVRIAAGESLVIGNEVRIDPEFGAGPGISIEGGTNHVIANVVEAGGVGIGLTSGARDNVLRGNRLRGDVTGVLTDATAERNLFTGNTFEGNQTQARDEGDANRWDDGRLGNFWSELIGPDADGDGVVDRARPIGPQGVDRYPLTTSPWSGPDNELLSSWRIEPRTGSSSTRVS